MRRIGIVLTFFATSVTCLAADDAKDRDTAKASASPSQSAGAETSQPPLAERIAAIANIHRDRKKQFYDELQSLAHEHKQFSEAEYGKKINEANQKYNDYLRPAADQLIELIKSNRSDPNVLEGVILLQGGMSYSLNVDPLLAEIVLNDQMKSPQMGRLCYQMRYENNDKVAETILTAVAEKHPLDWPSWWDGGSTDGPIQSAYNVLHWPTVYVLDSRGTIRYMEVSGKELDAAVDELLAKMEPTNPVSDSESKPNP
jgi:hypothetical protein